MTVLPATLTQVDPPGASLRFTLDPTLVVMSGGVGGWEEIFHPKRPSSTEYGGQPLRTLMIEALFDGWREQRSVEEPLRILDVWGRIPPGRREPAVLQFQYANYGPLRWVVQTLEFGESLRRADQARVRQAVTIGLLEFRDPEVRVSPVKRATPAPTPKAAPGKPSSGPKVAPSGRTYTVRSGDTLSRIALQHLGKAARWPEIARLNGVRDPRKLKVGQKLRLPS